MLVPKNPIQRNMILRKLKAEHHAAPGSTNYAVNAEINELYTGGYTDSLDKVDPRFRDYKQEEIDRQKRKAAAEKRKKKNSLLL